MRGDEGEADAAWYLLPSAFASVVVPLSRVRLSRVSASDVTPGRFVCLFVCECTRVVHVGARSDKRQLGVVQ